MALDLSREVVLRWTDADPKHIPLIRQGGVTAVMAPAANSAFASACEGAGLKVVRSEEVQLVEWKDIDFAAPGRMVALADGLWPGVSREPAVRGRGDELASASREPWVDANGYWVGCLRAVRPEHPAVLGYLPDAKAGVGAERIIRFDSLELALIEAWVSGGNYLLALEPGYRKALLSGDDKASAAWRSLGRTAEWLRKNVELFRQPAMPVITALIEPGADSAELVNLMYRRIASPAVADAKRPPVADPERILALVAAGIHAPSSGTRAAILRHAELGTAVITDAPGEKAWWRDLRMKRVKSEEDRDFYALGRGQVVAYKQPIDDPSEFALDVVDIVSHRRRAVRLWAAPAAIATATYAPRDRGAAVLNVINYGSSSRWEVMARIQGVYSKATLIRPGAEPLPLKAARRGTTTEIQFPEFARLAVVVFS